jgi:hypothetical protein
LPVQVGAHVGDGGPAVSVSVGAPGIGGANVSAGGSGASGSVNAQLPPAAGIIP